MRWRFPDCRIYTVHSVARSLCASPASRAYHSSISAISALFAASHSENDSIYSVTERRVPELIPVLGSQPAGDVSHKPGGRLTLLSGPGLQLPSQPLRGLLPVLLLGEQRHSGCGQFA